eukprot:m.64018 g.64018  ORF g.64018 m.64018 type:complete len:315 (+) comp23383_c0_seq2:202-1146(+)
MSLRRSGVVLSPIDRSTSTSTSSISTTSVHAGTTRTSPLPTSVSSPIKSTLKSTTGSYTSSTSGPQTNVYALRDTIKYLTQQNNTLTDRLKALRSATSQTLRRVRPTTQPLTRRIRTAEPHLSPPNADGFNSSTIKSQIQEELNTALSALKVASAKVTQLQRENKETQETLSQAFALKTQAKRNNVGCQVTAPLGSVHTTQNPGTLTIDCTCGRVQEVKTLKEMISELEEELATELTATGSVAPLDREYRLLRDDNNRLFLQFIDLQFSIQVARTLYKEGTIDNMSQIEFLKSKLQTAADRESVLKTKMRKMRL